MTITAADITHIAHLSRLEINQENINDYTKDLTNILQLVEQMNQLDTNQIPPLTNPLDATQFMRADRVTEADVREDMQLLAPQIADNLYLVPIVIDDAN